jgi:hypothetical protein
MNRQKGSKKLFSMAFAGLAILLAVSGPSQAVAMGGHGGGHSGGSEMHGGFNGHHGFDGHHDFRGEHRRFGFAPVYPYYGYPAPTYWYYCQSYGAYYPSVTSCPEGWVPVPAS